MKTVTPVQRASIKRPFPHFPAPPDLQLLANLSPMRSFSSSDCRDKWVMFVPQMGCPKIYLKDKNMMMCCSKKMWQYILLTTNTIWRSIVIVWQILVTRKASNKKYKWDNINIFKIRSTFQPLYVFRKHEMHNHISCAANVVIWPMKGQHSLKTFNSCHKEEIHCLN